MESEKEKYLCDILQNMKIQEQPLKKEKEKDFLNDSPLGPKRFEMGMIL